MTAGDPVATRLLALPRAERRGALEELVIAEFRATLDLPADADFPRQTGFFDLDMTSLRLTEIRQRLTRLLGGQVRIEALFEHATMERLLDHLAATMLADGEPAAKRDTAELAAGPPKLLDELLNQLYG
jgi:hypothetical protein